MMYKQSTLRVFILTAYAVGSTTALAEEIEALDTVDVIGSADAVENKKIGETVKTAKTITKQQVQDTRDLVKYETGISVVEKGRMGSSGYAVRGVEENRVNISIDGLQQAETLSSQGFKELFEGYGNFNNTRNGIEVENIKEVNIGKGANSTKVGSGALGGAVVFQTKDARDYLLDKDWYAKVKAGYASRNNQKTLSYTLAGRYKDFDALVVRTNRDGTNLENFGYDKFDDKVQGRSRRKADPYNISKNSTLIKLGYNLNENNRFTFVLDDGKTISKGNDWSYTLNFSTNWDMYKEEAIRHTNDSSTRKNIAFAYENYDSNPLWDSLKLTVSKQKISQRARTDDYCESGTECDVYKNSAGLQLKLDGDTIKFVDKYGNRPDYFKGKGHLFAGLRDSKGKWHENAEGTNTTAYNPKPLKDIWFDCSEIDCTKKIEAMKPITGYYKEGKLSEWTTVELDEHYTDPKTGKEYARTTSDVKLPTPGGGLLKADWKDRSLNTDTRQIDIDLSKSFDTKGIGHEFDYGFLYSESKKSMVNYEGYFEVMPGSKVAWWVNRSTGGKDCSELRKNFSPLVNELVCPYAKTPASSFLIPVDVKNGALHFADNIRVNNWLSFDASYRYDRVSYEPSYEEGKTPIIPSGLVVITPPPKKPNVPSDPPSCKDSKYNNISDIYGCTVVDPQFRIDEADYYKNKPKYDKILADWADDVEKNHKENARLLSQEKRNFSNHSYSLGTTIDPTEYLRIQAKYSTGFRAPTSDEIYFTFKHPSFTLYPGLELQPETAETKELAFTFYKDRSYLTLSAFRTDYENFIELEYQGKQSYPVGPNGGSLDFDTYRNVNQSSAKVYGFEVDGKAYLGDFREKFEGFSVGYKYTHQKGQIEGKDGYHPMNAIQPDKHVLNLGYISPDKNYGIDLFWTRVATKKAKDTYNQFHRFDGSKNTFAKYRSAGYSIFDLIGFYKPIKGMTIRAGIYNIFNKDYMTWDSARSIRSFGTSNMICKAGSKRGDCKYPDQGIERFHSPERNYKINFSYEF